MPSLLSKAVLGVTLGGSLAAALWWLYKKLQQREVGRKPRLTAECVLVNRCTCLRAAGVEWFVDRVTAVGGDLVEVFNTAVIRTADSKGADGSLRLRPDFWADHKVVKRGRSICVSCRTSGCARPFVCGDAGVGIPIPIRHVGNGVPVGPLRYYWLLSVGEATYCGESLRKLGYGLRVEERNVAHDDAFPIFGPRFECCLNCPVALGERCTRGTAYGNAKNGLDNPTVACHGGGGHHPSPRPAHGRSGPRMLNVHCCCTGRPSGADWPNAGNEWDTHTFCDSDWWVWLWKPGERLIDALDRLLETVTLNSRSERHPWRAPTREHLVKHVPIINGSESSWGATPEEYPPGAIRCDVVKDIGRSGEGCEFSRRKHRLRPIVIDGSRVGLDLKRAYGTRGDVRSHILSEYHEVDWETTVAFIGGRELGPNDTLNSSDVRRVLTLMPKAGAWMPAQPAVRRRVTFQLRCDCANHTPLSDLNGGLRRVIHAEVAEGTTILNAFLQTQQKGGAIRRIRGHAYMWDSARALAHTVSVNGFGAHWSNVLPGGRVVVELNSRDHCEVARPSSVDPLDWVYIRRATPWDESDDYVPFVPGDRAPTGMGVYREATVMDAVIVEPREGPDPLVDGVWW